MTRIFALVCFFVSAVATASTCIELNNIETITKAATNGTYRFAKNTNVYTNIEFERLSSYQEYLSVARHQVETRNPKADINCPIVTPTTQILNIAKNNTKVLDLVSPFELTHNEANADSSGPKQLNSKAVLLIHGLTDSPFMLHDLSAHLFNLGYDIRTLLIPGHGTAPSDLLDIEYQSWRDAATFAINSTLADYSEVYLGGFSTGGALILDNIVNRKHQANDELSKINGIMLWAPATKANSSFAWMAEYVDMLPGMDWMSEESDTDFAKYESFSFNAAAQVYMLMEHIQAISPQSSVPDIPLFMTLPQDDSTIDSETTIDLLSVWHSHDNRTTNSAKKDTLVYLGDKIPSKLKASIRSIVPKCTDSLYCDRVLQASHTGVTNSPDNQHYGFNGYNKNCDHYLAIPSKFKQCKQSDEAMLGETTEINIATQHLIQRLMFNPYFDMMTQELDAFISKTSKQ